MKRYVFVFVLCLCGSWTSGLRSTPTLLPDAPEAQEGQSEEPGASSTAPATPAIAQQSAAPKMQTRNDCRQCNRYEQRPHSRRQPSNSWALRPRIAAMS